MDALTRVGLLTQPTRLQPSSRSDSPKRSLSPTSITTTSSPPTTPPPARCLRTQPTQSHNNRLKPPPKPTLFSWMPRLSSRTTPRPPCTKATLCTPTLTPCLLGWPYCFHSYCTEDLPLISHLFNSLSINLPLTAAFPRQVGSSYSPVASQRFLPVTTYHSSIASACPALAFSPASASDLRSLASSPQTYSAHHTPSTAQDCPSLALPTASVADLRSSTPSPQSRAANPTPIPPPVCPDKADGETISTSSSPHLFAAKKSVGPHAPQWLPSHVPSAADTYAEWVDSLSEDFAGCLASGPQHANSRSDIFLLQDSYDHAPPKLDRIVPFLASIDQSEGDTHSQSSWRDISTVEDDSDSNWESCDDSDSSCAESEEASLLATPSTSAQFSKVPVRATTLRLLLPYPPSNAPGIISSWWQDHQFLIVDSVFFHGYKCHPLDIEHWLGLPSEHVIGSVDPAYPQRCKERVAGLCDYLYLPDFDFDDDDNEVPSRGCLYSQYLINLLNDLLRQLLSMYKLRVARLPSPCSSFPHDDVPCSAYCLPLSFPHTIPTRPDMYDHCKAYNAAWYNTHYNNPGDWYNTTELASIIATPETSALIASQFRLFTNNSSSGQLLSSTESQTLVDSTDTQCSPSKTSPSILPFDPQSCETATCSYPSDSGLQISEHASCSLPPHSSDLFPPHSCESQWDMQSAASTCSYLSASDVPISIPVPPEIYIPWTGPTAIERLMTIVPRNPDEFDDRTVFSDTLDGWESDTLGYESQTVLPPSHHTVHVPLLPPNTTHDYTRADEQLMHARMVSLSTYQAKLSSILWSHRHSPPLHLHNSAYHATLTPTHMYTGTRHYSPQRHLVRNPPPLVLTHPVCVSPFSSYDRTTIRTSALRSLRPYTQDRVKSRPLRKLGACGALPSAARTLLLVHHIKPRAATSLGLQTPVLSTPIVLAPCISLVPSPFSNPQCTVTLTKPGRSLTIPFTKRILSFLPYLLLLILVFILHVSYKLEYSHTPVVTTIPAPTFFYASLPCMSIPVHTHYVHLTLRLSPALSKCVWHHFIFPYTPAYSDKGILIPIPPSPRPDVHTATHFCLDTLFEYHLYYPP